ncbi:2,3,4,5-tetrahydropyridine-2,6-dicarboxylate N-acetyltransferase [Sporomusa silvacetica DSM 10669]|uniref:2,3,4,5-tetrahydropyridine-2,6-dicarboxylate N-acetyltransferase n=1 Tax=Sporomusa silvacetica DSM 10669 TaxID=1123289 RepID=A0ABZ3IGZ7_9FIRM|nr:DapH/DapD/GlmU-related protein [Sporomusa silvacetica]OZC21433.1 galactoside O-acetyltransferase [Sporomusa silvacetica DSM 10669]
MKFKLSIKSLIYRLRGEVCTEDLIKLGLRVGKNFSRQAHCMIDDSYCWLIQIGDNVTLAPRVHILAHDASTGHHIGLVRIGKVNIGNNVFIGAGSIILPNVSIGDNVIVGAGSVVTKDIAANVVAAGNPARIISSIDDFIQKNKALMKKRPWYGERYTLRRNVTREKKRQMILELEDEVGFII